MTRLFAGSRMALTAAMATLLADTLALAAPPLGGGLPRVAFFVTVYALMASVNIAGARAGARLSTVLAVVKLLPLLLLVGAGLPAIQSA